jgi:hypothetical protein
MENSKNTIHEALGLSEEWRKKNSKSINKEITGHETVSDSIEHSILRLKTEEFGEMKESSITDYEKKLYYSGYMMAQEMMEQRQKAAKAAILGHMFMEMMGGSKDEE